MKILKENMSKYTVVALAVIVLATQFSNHYWLRQNKIITWDVLEYYQYLPATFIYHDVTLSFMNDGNRNDYWNFWPHPSPTGGWVFKFTMGMSILYSPFFLVAHGYALLFGNPDGYSTSYKFALVFSCWAYLLIGLIFLRKILRNRYSEAAISLSLIAVVLGTNLLYYTGVRSAMSHAYSFSLFAVFTYLVIRWYKNPQVRTSIFLGLLSGLITLIRPTNIIILFIFLLFGLTKKEGLNSRIKVLLNQSWLIVLMAVMFLLVWVPQLLYWHAVTGELFYYSYNDEGFFFNNPQFIRALFSYRNGWLLYTPVMAFGLTGIWFLFKSNSEFKWPVLVFTLLNIYIVTSWWCWWYVGFGNRAFIDSYAILAIPMAAVFEFFLNRTKVWKTAFTLVFVFFLYTNIFQVWQYKNGYIQPDSMTKKAYWRMFLNTGSKDKFWDMIEKPDYEKAKKGIYK